MFTPRGYARLIDGDLAAGGDRDAGAALGPGPSPRSQRRPGAGVARATAVMSDVATWLLRGIPAEHFDNDETEVENA